MYVLSKRMLSNPVIPDVRRRVHIRVIITVQTGGQVTGVGIITRVVGVVEVVSFVSGEVGVVVWQVVGPWPYEGGRGCVGGGRGEGLTLCLLWWRARGGGPCGSWLQSPCSKKK